MPIILLTKMLSNVYSAYEEIDKLSSEGNKLIISKRNFDEIINNINFDEIIKQKIKKIFGERKIDLVDFDPEEEGGIKGILEGIQSVDYIASRATTPLKKEVLELAKKKGLKAIFHPTQSTPGIDIKEATKLDIAVFNTMVSVEKLVKETLRSLVDLLGKDKRLDQSYTRQKWDQARAARDDSAIKEPDLDLSKVQDLNIGIYGFGRVGKSLAKELINAGNSVKVCSSPRFDKIRAKKEFDDLRLSDKQNEGKIERVEEIKDIADCDVIINCASFKEEENKHAFDKNFFNICSQKPIFIQIGGRGILDEEALKQAIEVGKISRAHVDTFEKEGSDHASPLYDLRDYNFKDSILLTHHVLGLSKQILFEASLKRGDLIINFEKLTNEKLTVEEFMEVIQQQKHQILGCTIEKALQRSKNSVESRSDHPSSSPSSAKNRGKTSKIPPFSL